MQKLSLEKQIRKLGLKQTRIIVLVEPAEKPRRIDTKAYVSSDIPGLAIHGVVADEDGNQDCGTWAITHISSGYNFGHERYKKTPEKAYGLAKKLVSAGLDFTKPKSFLLQPKNKAKILEVFEKDGSI